MALRPAKSARPGSKTSGMTWKWRLPCQSLRASRARKAQAGGEHLRAGEAVVGQQAVKVEAHQVGDEQEEAAEVGVEPAGSEVELALVGDGRRERGGRWGFAAQAGGAAGELGQAGVAEHAADGAGADRDFLVVGEVGCDLGGGPVAFGAQGEDELVALGAGVGLVAAAGVGQKEGRMGIAEKGGAEVAQRAGGVAEAHGGLPEGGLIDKEGAQGLVAAMVGVGGIEEKAPGLIHIHAAMITNPPRNVPHRLGGPWKVPEIADWILQGHVRTHRPAKSCHPVRRAVFRCCGSYRGNNFIICTILCPLQDPGIGFRWTADSCGEGLVGKRYAGEPCQSSATSA